MRKLFEGQGWALDRVKGSHHIMKKENRTVPIPIHGNRDLGRGLEKALKKILEGEK